MAQVRLSIITELTRFAPTQSTILNFNSYALVGNTYMAANSSGIYSLGIDTGAGGGVSGGEMEWGGDGEVEWEDGDVIVWDDAAGTPISGYFKLPRTDFGIENEKRLRSMYVGYETDGSLLITITPDEDTTRSQDFTLTGRIDTQKQHSGRIALRRDLRGRYFDFKIANVNGSDFSIDSIKIVITVLGRKPRS